MSKVAIELNLNDHNYQKIRSMINNPNLHSSVGDIIWSQNKLLLDMDIVLDYLNRRIKTVSNSDDSIRIQFNESNPYSKIPKIPDYYHRASDILAQTLLSLFEAMSETYFELLRIQIARIEDKPTE